MEPLSPAAEILLLILAANGGSMDKEDADREFARVTALPPEKYHIWRKRSIDLAYMHAKRILKGEDNEG
jgi:hypothetical protein